MSAFNHWRDEKRSAYLYAIIASTEKNVARKQLFTALAEEAETQARVWEKLPENSRSFPTYQPDIRTHIAAWLVRNYGAARIKPILAALKVRGLSVYGYVYKRDTKNRLDGFHPMPTTVDEVGGSHRLSGNSGGLRAAVFGVNDGLVSIACLVMGVTGAAANHDAILITGIAGLLAGAFSMAAGEYISMQSQREMFEYQIGLEKAELAQYPDQEAAELALIYTARGMDNEQAVELAKRMVADPILGLDTLAREELGLNPNELGSAWVAAFSSFTAFTLGGLIPLLPYLLTSLSFSMQYALQISIGLTALALFGIGAALSLFTGRQALWGGTRMLLIGGTAGSVTYWIGKLLGASLL